MSHTLSDGFRIRIWKQNSFGKRSKHSEENSLLQAKTFFGFVKHFSLFAKGVYETCDCNFFSFVIIIVVVFFQ